VPGVRRNVDDAEPVSCYLLSYTETAGVTQVMASSSDDNLDDSHKDDASPHDKAPTRKVSEYTLNSAKHPSSV